MVVGSVVVAIALLILGWTGDIVKFFIGDGESVGCHLLNYRVDLILTGRRQILLLFLLRLWHLRWWILL